MNARSTGWSNLAVLLLGLLIVALSCLGTRRALAQTYPAPQGCGSVAYEAGWNLVGGSSGTLLTGAAAIYGLAPGATSFANLSENTALFGGEGVWAYFYNPTTITSPCVGTASLTYTEPAGSSSVGDPYNTPAVLSASGGTVFAITFNAATNSWNSWTEIDNGGTLTLGVGQAAYVFTYNGGTVTFTST